MSLATQKAFERCAARVKKEKITWEQAAKEEGLSITTAYRLKKKAGIKYKGRPHGHWWDGK